jgi:hypothetical protein
MKPWSRLRSSGFLVLAKVRNPKIFNLVDGFKNLSYLTMVRVQ